MLTHSANTRNQVTQCYDFYDPMSFIDTQVTCGLLHRSISIIEPIKKECELPLLSDEDFRNNIEWPLIPAVSILQRAGYQCAYTSAHPHGRTKAQIWVIQDWQNEECLCRLPEYSPFDMNGKKYLIFLRSLDQSTTCRDIVDWGITTALEIVRNVTRDYRVGGTPSLGCRPLTEPCVRVRTRLFMKRRM
jgi:hypothetical protein